MSRTQVKPFKKLVQQWHRRLGITSAAVVVLLCVTGMLLNHSQSLHLNQKPVRTSWILSFYGIKIPTITAYAAGKLHVEQIGRQLSIDGEPLAECDGSLVGAAQLPELFVIACSHELILLTASGEIIEHINSAYGLPVPLQAIASCAATLCLQSSAGNYQTDSNFAEFVTNSNSIQPSARVPVSLSVQQKLRANYTGTQITWMRVLQDIHAGRMLGKAGPWIMDLFAVFFLLLAISGTLLWWRNGHRRR